MDVSVREVEDGIFREFRSKAISNGLKTGEALTEAMKEWAEKVGKKKPKKSFFDLKPWDWKDKEASAKVDEMLYGGKI